MSIKEHFWTPERIAQLPRSEIQNLRSDAFALEAHAVVARCDAELLKAKLSKKRSPRLAGKTSRW
ncbi:hypothetical protein ABIC33_006481 [Variovorax sp. 1140]|uniref:hypothetical protein n=1 Tax=Variovorax atrisoli TaxID=3394203 RepID=UPI003393D4F5